MITLSNLAIATGLPPAVYRDVAHADDGAPGVRHRPDALIIGRNVRGSRPPMFFCSGMNKTVIHWLLGAEQPVYWMRSLIGCASYSPENTLALAHYYASEIQEIYPQGPFTLGGYGEGARIAAYLAAELEARGREVRLLFQIEQWAPVTYHGRTRLLFAQSSQFNPFFKFGTQQSPLGKYYRGELAVSELSCTADRLQDAEHITRLMAGIQRDIDDALAHRAMFDALPPDEQPAQRQCLTLNERSLGIHITCPRLWSVDSRLDFEVEVENRSGTDWQPHASSGLCVTVRWIEAQGRRSPVAGKLKLHSGLRAGEKRRFTVQVRTPRRHGRWTLDVDLAEDGLCLFQDVTTCTFQRGILLLSGGPVLRALLNRWYSHRRRAAQGSAGD